MKNPSMWRCGALLLIIGVLASAQTAAVGATTPPRIQDEDDGGWPREIDDPRATIVMYQPELESFAGNTLSGRAAVSVTETGETTPVFGAVWMDARIETDREERMVQIQDVTVTNVRFPNATAEQQQELANLIEEELPQWQLLISMDRVIASLEVAERERESANLRMDPPIIRFVDFPAVLISIDGEPLLQPAGDDDRYMRVVNSAFTIIQDTGTDTYYLYAGDDTWYASSDVVSGWQVTRNVPTGVDALKPEPPPESEELAADEAEADEPDAIPQIIIATEPTELIVTEGAPEYSPILGTDLLYVTNTESDVVMEVSTQRHFIVLSGRWYAGAGLEGPWQHISPSDLPEDFSKIPPESEMGSLLVSVPNTPEAKDAVADQQIPQTAAIDRSTTTTVEFDGDPEWEDIEGTSMQYATNTASQVLRAEGSYFLVEEGVWYVSDAPEGTYRVATERPGEVEDIPASCPHYNVKYVYVYDVQPEVVYVGYTPGYTYSYVYGGTVIYGTGYYYVPWYRTVYYPRPPTWGFHVRYNPWYGWGFGFSYSTGRFTFSIGYGGWGGHGGWWRRPYYGYRRGYHRGWHRGYRAGARAGYVAGRHHGARNNIYRSQRNANRVSNLPATANRPQARAATNRANNVYTNNNGDVFRRNQNGNWEQRGSNGWENRQPTNQQRQQLDRSSQSRSQGASRTNSFRSSRPSRGGGRGRGRG